MRSYLALAVNVFVLCAAAAACSDETAGPEGNEPLSEEENEATPSLHPFRSDAGVLAVHAARDNTGTAGVVDARPSTLCENAWYADGGAGRYLVADITSVEEYPVGQPELADAYTYVTFSRLDDYSGDAPEQFILRMQGGPLSNGNFRGALYHFEQGEELVLLMKAPESDSNAGFGSTATPWIWRAESESTWTNSVVNLTEDELVEGLRAAYSSLPEVDQPFYHDCPVQIPWEQCAPESLIPREAPRDFDTPAECEIPEESPPARVPGAHDPQEPN